MNKEDDKMEIITDINSKVLEDDRELDGIFTFGEMQPIGKVIKTFSFADS